MPRNPCSDRPFAGPVLASPQLTMPPKGLPSPNMGDGDGDASCCILRKLWPSGDGYGDGDTLQKLLLSTNWLGVALIHAATVKGAAPIGRLTLAPCAANRHDCPSSTTSFISVRIGGTAAKGGYGGGGGAGGSGDGGGGEGGGGDGGGGDGGGPGGGVVCVDGTCSGGGGAGTQHTHCKLLQLSIGSGDGDACICRRAICWQPIIM